MKLDGQKGVAAYLAHQLRGDKTTDILQPAGVM